MAVKIGQIGIGHAHAAGKAQVLREAPNVTFVGIWEPDPPTFAARSDNPAYRGIRWLNADELLDDPSIEGIFVETLPVHNLHWARRALEAGKHVLIDKAPGVSLDELRELLDLAATRKLHVQIGYNFRFNPAFEFAFDAVKSGLLGDIFKVEAELPTSLSGYEERRSDNELYPGGTFYELGCHLTDLVVIVLGAPRKVTSILRGDFQHDGMRPYIDNTVAIFEYDRAVAMVQSWAMEVAPLQHRRFEIYGTRGSIRIEPLEPPKLQLCLAEPQGSYAAGWQSVDVGDRPRYVGDVAEFVAVVREGRRPRYDAAHDLDAHRVLLEACKVASGGGYPR
jgi:predicted dehydrogenase